MIIFHLLYQKGGLFANKELSGIIDDIIALMLKEVVYEEYY